MQKALFSSPAAAIQSTETRLSKLSQSQTDSEPTADVVREMAALNKFLSTLKSIDKTQFSKYQLLLESLRNGHSQWNVKAANDRIVFFSERIETLNWLKENLVVDLALKPNQLEVLYGGLPDTEQQILIDRFGRSDDPLRVLLCSDVASEGLNLHYFCHRIIHFDMPWSLMTYLQRNGRVDRFGQKERPIIIYLQTKSKNEKIRGDQRILEILQTKDEQANKNLGDPLSFLDVYDEEKEAEKVAGFMAKGLTAELVDQELEETRELSTSSQLDQFNAFLASLTHGNNVPELPDAHVTAISLFADHFQYAKSALELLQLSGRPIQWSCADSSRTLTITAPTDLQSRLRQIPQEAHRSPYVLNANPETIADAMETARQAKAEENTWPITEYLWQQHPISEWLADSIISLFSGHKAPVLKSGKLRPGETAFVIAGAVPNRKGRPVVVEWRAVSRLGNGPFVLETFEEFAVRAGLQDGVLPNNGWGLPGDLQESLPQAVRTMRKHMEDAQKSFDDRVQPQLNKMLADLNSLRKRKVEQLDFDFANSVQLETVKAGKLAAKLKQVEDDFDDYQAWVHETMETEPQAFIQVIAAVHNVTGAN
jgi:superfamily II DNA/RNA helicase